MLRRPRGSLQHDKTRRCVMPRKKKKSADTNPAVQEPHHDKPSASGRYAEDDDIRAEFTDAQRLASRERNRNEYTDRSAKLTGGDVDADWKRADVGEETVGGSNPTPDQDVVEEVGNAVGLPYGENEPLRLGDKEAERDDQRWELDPASAEDYP